MVEHLVCFSTRWRYCFFLMISGLETVCRVTTMQLHKELKAGILKFVGQNLLGATPWGRIDAAR